MFEYGTLNAHRAMEILGIAAHDDRPGFNERKTCDLLLTTWAAQQALSRPGRRGFSDKVVAEIKAMTRELGRLKWPRGVPR